MKSKSVFKSVCVFVGLGFLLTIVWLIIFSMTITPDDAEMTVEPFSGASVTFGFACALIANFIYQYNSAKSLEQRIYSNTSSLESIKIRNRDLVDKANRLIDKHQKNEKESYIDIENNMDEFVCMPGREAVNKKLAREVFMDYLGSVDRDRLFENYNEYSADEEFLDLIYELGLENKLQEFREKIAGAILLNWANEEDIKVNKDMVVIDLYNRD